MAANHACSGEALSRAACVVVGLRASLELEQLSLSAAHSCSQAGSAAANSHCARHLLSAADEPAGRARARPAHRPFEAWAAHAVFCGHDHEYERILNGAGFPYFVNGLGGAGIDAFSVTPEAGVVRPAGAAGMRVRALST